MRAHRGPTSGRRIAPSSWQLDESSTNALAAGVGPLLPAACQLQSLTASSANGADKIDSHHEPDGAESPRRRQAGPPGATSTAPGSNRSSEGSLRHLLGSIRSAFARRSRRKESDKASSIQQHLRAIRHAENLDRQTHFRRSQGKLSWLESGQPAGKIMIGAADERRARTNGANCLLAGPHSIWVGRPQAAGWPLESASARTLLTCSVPKTERMPSIQSSAWRSVSTARRAPATRNRNSSRWCSILASRAPN